MKTTKYHVSNLGSFAGNIPTDLDGYTYLTAKGWLNESNMDAMVEMDEDYAEELAADARRATAAAEEGIGEWQEK